MPKKVKAKIDTLVRPWPPGSAPAFMLKKGEEGFDPEQVGIFLKFTTEHPANSQKVLVRGNSIDFDIEDVTGG